MKNFLNGLTPKAFALALLTVLLVVSGIAVAATTLWSRSININVPLPAGITVYTTTGTPPSSLSVGAVLGSAGSDTAITAAGTYIYDYVVNNTGGTTISLLLTETLPSNVVSAWTNSAPTAIPFPSPLPSPSTSWSTPWTTPLSLTTGEWVVIQVTLTVSAGASGTYTFNLQH